MDIKKERERTKEVVKQMVTEAVDAVKEGIEFKKLIELPAFKQLEREWNTLIDQFKSEKADVPYENFHTSAKILVGRDTPTDAPLYLSGQEYLGLRILEEVRVNIYKMILASIHDRVSYGIESEEKLRKYNAIPEANKLIKSEK